MDANDWRIELRPDSRQRILNKIMDTLTRHLPTPGPEGLQMLERIAVSFEEKIYMTATSQNDYLRKISLKMLTMEKISQNNEDAAINGDKLFQGEFNMDSNDWRNHLEYDSRWRIVYKIMETLKMHLPRSGPEGLQELKKIAVQFEGKVYMYATSQSDYLKKISLKMLTLEKISLNTEDTDNWRKQLQSDSRLRVVNKIMDSFKKLLPISGPEGLKELMNIAVQFEEKIYMTAKSQVDYLRKISLKMLTLEKKYMNVGVDNPIYLNSAGSD